MPRVAPGSRLVASDVDGQAAEPPARSLGKHCLDVLQLCAWGVLGVGVGSLPPLAYRYAPGVREQFDVDMAKMETPMLSAEFPAGNWFVQELWRNGVAVSTAPLLVMLPALVAPIVGRSLARNAFVVSTILAAYVVFIWLSTWVGSLLVMILMSMPYVALVLSLKLLRCPYWLEAVKLSVFLIMSQIPVLLFNTMPDDVFSKLVFSCVTLPLLREAALILVRSLVRRLMVLDNSLATWPLLLAVQTVYAINVRLLLSSIQDQTWFVLSLLVQAAIEIIMRSTMGLRDELLDGLVAQCRRCCNRRRRRRPQSLQEEAQARRRQPVQARDSAMKTVTAAFEQQLARTERRAKERALFLACEVISEYVAIFMTTIMVVAFRSAPLTLALQLFSEREDPFYTIMPLDSVFRSTAMMLAIEMIVDLVGSTCERRRGTDVAHAWRQQPRGLRIKAVVLASLAASGTAIAGVQGSTMSTDQCDLRNLCYCAGNRGLRPNSLPDIYCRQVLYPPSGVPQGLQVAVLLDPGAREAWPRARLDAAFQQHGPAAFMLDKVLLDPVLDMSHWEQETQATSLELAGARGAAVLVLDGSSPDAALTVMDGDVQQPPIAYVGSRAAESEMAEALERLRNITGCAAVCDPISQ